MTTSTQLLATVIDNVAALDEIIARQAARGLDQLDAVGRAILLLGLAELKFRDDVPTKVVINEAVELAKRYGAAESYKFVNAVLDKTRVSCCAAAKAAERRHDRRVRDHRALLHAARAAIRDVVLGVGDDAAVLAVHGLWPSRSTRSSRACTFPTAWRRSCSATGSWP